MCRVTAPDALCRDICTCIITELLPFGAAHNTPLIYLHVGVRNSPLIACHDLHCSSWDGCCYACDEPSRGYREPLSESIMTFSDIDTHRKCSNLAIKQPLQGRNHTVICNSDVFIYSYTTQFIEGDKTHVLFVIIGCHTYLDLLYSTHCVLYFRDGHIVYHYYGIRCIYRMKKSG